MKILIADDETPIREWIQFSIERGNNPDFEIVGVAENGNEAFELAVKYQVDTVITDIKMPGMDGLMLMKKLLEEIPYVSFIILTNYAEFSYAREAITYGARKYFLKSELRGQDILEALMEIHESNEKLIMGKEEDCYFSGYLDIYTCCCHMEDAEFVCGFWRKHQFRENEMFCVAAFKSTDSWDQKGFLDVFIKAQKIHILRPVLRKESIYLIMQSEDERKLEESLAAFYETWSVVGGGVLVVGPAALGIAQIMPEIDRTDRMLQYEFFYNKGCFRINDDKLLEPLDREKIRREYQKILNSLLHDEEDKISKDIILWFGYFKEVCLQDTDWAKEICIKFVIRLEEKCAEHFSDYQEEHMVTGLQTVELCRDSCIKLISMLYSGNKFSYSQSIRETVQYIHQNYANQDLSLKVVAQAICRSPEYLSRLFKSETGQNFSNYLMFYRLERARALLLNTDMKIYEIAYAVGYTTPSYFSKVYHEYMGITPELARGQKIDRKS